MVNSVAVMHLGHSNAAGGAELALLRILACEPRWDVSLSLPSNDEHSFGVFEPLVTKTSGRLRLRGPAQVFGASKVSSGLFKTTGFIARVLGQAITIRFSGDFRRAQVLHANTSRAAIYGALACLVSRKKLVIHLRDMVNKESLGSLGFVGFTRLALPRANGVIGNSRTTLVSAEPYIRPGCKTDVIPSAAGLRAGAMVARDNQRIKTVGMVARLDEWKGQSLLIRAFAQVYENTDVRLVLAGGALFGNEDYAHDLRELAIHLGISAQVDFVGHVKDVSDVISGLDICVQCSLRPEPLGQNLLQYLAAGRAVVAADAGGPAEWIRHDENGFLFKLGDESALVTALRTLDADPKLRARLSSAAAKTPGLLCDENVTELHADFFERITWGEPEGGEEVRV